MIQVAHYSKSIVSWPRDWPRYKQDCFASYKDSCDMLRGPCRCGAWHQLGEFQMKKGRLYRHKGLVPAVYGLPTILKLLRYGTWCVTVDGDLQIFAIGTTFKQFLSTLDMFESLRAACCDAASANCPPKLKRLRQLIWEGCCPRRLEK